jgi:uncharacterized membrane protein YbaN (DUF454 family)
LTNIIEWHIISWELRTEMKNVKSWIIIICCIGAGILVWMTNTTMLNKILVDVAALFGTGVMLPTLKK